MVARYKKLTYIQKYRQKRLLHMLSEIAVIVKDDERTYTQRFLEYENFSVSDTDETLNRYIKQTLEEFQGEPQDVKIRITIQI